MKIATRTNAARQVWNFVAAYCDEIASGTEATLDCDKTLRIGTSHVGVLRSLAKELRARATGRKGKAIGG